MTSEETQKTNFGLSLGDKAPLIDTLDVLDNEINLIEILKSNRGLLIDFFRGAW